MALLKPQAGVPRKRANKQIAHSAGVQLAITKNARAIEGVARATLARHRETGQHRIEGTAGRVDRFISLVGPSALAVEFGHITFSGEHVEGVKPLRTAVRAHRIG